MAARLPDPGDTQAPGSHSLTLVPYHTRPQPAKLCSCVSYLVHVAHVIFSVNAGSMICFPSGTSWT